MTALNKPISLSLKGTPTTAVSSPFTIKVTGCGGGVSTHLYTVTIQAAPKPCGEPELASIPIKQHRGLQHLSQSGRIHMAESERKPDCLDDLQRLDRIQWQYLLLRGYGR